jgi:hypothetical protein
MDADPYADAFARTPREAVMEAERILLELSARIDESEREGTTVPLTELRGQLAVALANLDSVVGRLP